jgi:hypothetical protein
MTLIMCLNFVYISVSIMSDNKGCIEVHVIVQIIKFPNLIFLHCW